MAAPFERPAEHGLRGASGIGVGGVEEIDARIEAAFYHLHRSWFVGLSAESHSAEAEAGDFQTGFREGDLIHLARIPDRGQAGNLPHWGEVLAICGFAGGVFCCVLRH
jgi:hypothetical protein